jgi:hypothetical protein
MARSLESQLLTSGQLTFPEPTALVERIGDFALVDIIQ